jgi:uncharacterized protein (TIGR03437 family)
VVGAGATIMGARQHASVQWAGVCPGVDAALAVSANVLILRFDLAAGASISPLRIKVSGITSLFVEDRGSLDADGGTLLLGPGALQGQTPVRVRYAEIDPTHFTFLLDPYDTSQPLTIEMRVAFGIQLQTVETVTVPSGSYYLLVNVPEVRTPAGGTCIANSVCQDAAAFKFNAAGDPQYVTYLRGSGNQQVQRGAALQRSASSGQSPDDLVCLTGETSSSDFPVTPNAAQKANAGNGDLFVAALDGNTGGLVYATFLGGPNEDMVWDLHLDSASVAYVMGSSNAAGLPVTRTVFPPGQCPSYYGVPFAAAIDVSTGELRYLTYLPGCSATSDVDSSGNLYFTGYTDSSFPVTKGAYLTQAPGPISAFVARLNANGTALDFGTYLGASNYWGRDIAVDSHGGVWLTLNSFSTSSFFLAKVESAGSKLAYYSPFFQGDILVDGSDNLLFFTNGPNSTSLATASGMLSEPCGSDSLFKFDPAGTLILERGLPGTPLGFDSQGRLLVAAAGGVTAIDLTPNPRGWAACLYNAASWDRQNQVAPGEIVSIMGTGLGPPQGSAFRLDAQGRVPTLTGGTRVLFNGVPAPVLYAQDGQVNAIVPFGISPGSSLAVQVEYQGQPVTPLTVPVYGAQPGVFTADGSGSGLAVAVNQDGTLNSEANPAPAGSIVSLFVNGLGATSPASVEGALAASTAPQPTAAYTGQSPRSAGRCPLCRALPRIAFQCDPDQSARSFGSHDCRRLYPARRSDDPSARRGLCFAARLGRRPIPAVNHGAHMPWK